jgi:tetratricopeptide (TPR) repeat protein
VLWSAPSIALFYVRHTLLPVGLGPNYPLAPIDSAIAGFGNVVLPALALAATGALLALASRKNELCARLWPWFVFPLLPVFDVRAFVPEDVVHDRYLYLPSFAAIAMIVSMLASLAQRLRSIGPRPMTLGTAMAGGALALASIPLTIDYSHVWRDDVSLWERGIRTDPLRAFSHAQLGDAYRREGRLADARRELERAAELNPMLTAAQVGLGEIARQEGRYAEAVARIEPVYARAPSLAPAIEVLGMAYQAQGKLAQAIAVYERGRRDLPYQRGPYTVNLAVLRRQAGRADLAKAELESLGPTLGGSHDPKVLRAWWYLGELEREAGHAEAARSYYQRYLTATAALADDPQVRSLRNLVARRNAAPGAP